MVRLVITDFTSRDNNDAFYLDYNSSQTVKMFTYDSFKKHRVYLSKYDITNKLYSINLFSKKHLSKNQFMIYISDSEYIILFNHKTVYSSKINENFITDDMIKSILITKHIAMLTSKEDIEKIHYVLNSKHSYAIENILKQNTRNEKNEIIATSLGDIEDLVKPLNELDSTKSHIFKNATITALVIGIGWFMFSGLDLLTKKIIDEGSINTLKKEIRLENRSVRVQNVLLNRKIKESEKLTQCITVKEDKND